MRITFPTRSERIGAVRIHDTGKIIELDSAGNDLALETSLDHTYIPARTLEAMHRQLTIVVPVKNERRNTLRGVLAGIPGGCRVVVVSASDADPIDRFMLEREIIDEFRSATGRTILHIHQRDASLAAIVAAAMPELLDEDGLVRRGKGEAMLVGALVADASESDGVGYIDADNYVPGAVNEYVRIFSATLALAVGDHTMGRISWQSKPKVQNDQLVFNRWGRSTTVSNRVLNEVISHYLGEGTRMITTGNAGEHVISMPLARILRFSGSFGAETGQFVDILEQFGGIIAPVAAVPARVDVVQTETINPHFHEDKGDDHVAVMREISLAAITSSPICPPAVADAYSSSVAPPPRYPMMSTRGQVDLEQLIDLSQAPIE
jgi:mannosyl-3-phosphoglycerate synthase